MLYPDKSVHLIGYSIGGRICLEMALQKQQKDPTGPAIKSITLIESPLPLIERTFKSVKPGLDREMKIMKCLLNVLNLHKNIVSYL